jgi:hypothetical protein
MLVTDHHLVAVKFRERLSVNRQSKQTIGMERFYVIKLNDSETEKYNLHKLLIRFSA